MEVFLFPLVNVTLFPGTTKPLNIFEARYLKMVEDSLKTQTPIALGFVDDPLKIRGLKVGEPVDYVQSVCGYGHPQVIEERENGSRLVFLYGMGKLKIHSLKKDSEPYLVCEAEVIKEETVIGDFRMAQLRKLHQMLNRWIERNIIDPAQREIFTRSISQPLEIIGASASYLIRDHDIQQEVLEKNSLEEKIELIYRLASSSELAQ